MNRNLAKSIAFSFLSPVLLGLAIGLYYAPSFDGNKIQLILRMLLSALSNAHIAGLSMAVFVVPGYVMLQRRNRVGYGPILSLGLLGGGLFSWLFGAADNAVFTVNTMMAILASGLFLYMLRITEKKTSQG